MFEALPRSATKARRELKKNRTNESREAYNQARNRFGRASDEETENRRKEYLSTPTHENLFHAKKFALGRQPLPFINTLIEKSGEVCTFNKQKARVMFETTCVANAPRNLDNVESIIYPITADNTEKIETASGHNTIHVISPITLHFKSFSHFAKKTHIHVKKTVTPLASFQPGTLDDVS